METHSAEGFEGFLFFKAASNPLQEGRKNSCQKLWGLVRGGDLQQAVMELASAMNHRLHFFDPSFSRKCTHIRFTAKFLSMRCSAAETRARSMDDEWEGSARLSIVQKTLQNIPQRMPGKPPIDIQSDEPSKDSDESVVPSVQSETPKVTGKTRGEIFLERSREMLEVHSERSSARAIKTKERRIRKTEKNAVAKHTEPCCYGCGTILQTSAVEAPGYVPIDTFEVVRKQPPFLCFDLFCTFLFQMFILQFSRRIRLITIASCCRRKGIIS